MNGALRAFGVEDVSSLKSVAAPVQRPRDKGPPFLNRLAALYYCQCFGLWTYIWVTILCSAYFHPLILIPAALYALYAVGPGSRAPREGYWPAPLRHWGVWRALAGYFPEVRLHKTAELSPDRSYIFGYHPHGQLVFGMWLTFGSTVLGFDKLFPGIEARVTTLNINFTAPVLREYLLLAGTCSVSRDAILNVLEHGKSVVVAVGGGLESLIAVPGRYDLVLNRRRGFVRCALMAGSPLVPCLGFGEPDTYTTANSLPCNSPPRRLQHFLVKRLGFTLPLVLGKGLLLPWGLLPYPVPLNVVIGAPIEVPRCDGSPGDAQFEAMVDKYHAQYVAALKGLYDDHREKFAPEAVEHLTLVE